MAEIADVSDHDGSSYGELYDLNEVLATETQRRHEVKESTPVANTTAPPPPAPARNPPAPLPEQRRR